MSIMKIRPNLPNLPNGKPINSGLNGNNKEKLIKIYLPNSLGTPKKRLGHPQKRLGHPKNVWDVWGFGSNIWLSRTPFE